MSTKAKVAEILIPRTWTGERMVSKSGTEHLMTARMRCQYREALCQFSINTEKEQPAKLTECQFCIEVHERAQRDQARR